MTQADAKGKVTFMKMRNRHGETLIESLVSMLIIAMTTAMLTMTVATVLRSYQQAEQTQTFADEGWTDSLSASSNTTINVQVTLDSRLIGTADVKPQGTGGTDGRLYYYVGNWVERTS